MRHAACGMLCVVRSLRFQRRGLAAQSTRSCSLGGAGSAIGRKGRLKDLQKSDLQKSLLMRMIIIYN
jgi:hypothetical protein